MTAPHRCHGIYAATVAPLDEDERLDEVALGRHLERLCAVDGITGFLVNGHAGENFTLDAAEQARIVALARRVVGDRAIVAGVNEEASEAAARLGEAAMAAGADALLPFPPFSWALAQDADLVLAHHERLVRATGAPLVLYQAPVTAGRLAYPAETLAALVRLPGVVGIKEGSWEAAAYEANRRLVHALAPEIAVMASGDEHLFTCFVVGSEGSMVSLAALVPDLVVTLERAVAAGDLKAANAAHERIQPLARAIYGLPPGGRATARLKWCLAALGHIPTATMRAPMPPLRESEVRALDAAMANAGLRP